MFEWLLGSSNSSSRKPQRELDVTTGVWYDEDSEKFLVGYGFRNRVENLGMANSLSKAIEGLGRDISSSGSLYTKIRAKISSASECSLEMTVYHTKPESEYVVELSDGSGESVVGRGRKMSSAVEDLAGRVSVEKSE